MVKARCSRQAAGLCLWGHVDPHAPVASLRRAMGAQKLLQLLIVLRD
jgi:hypothetical protein